MDRLMPKADLVIVNADAWTADEKGTRVSAVAVAGGRIAYAGTDAGARAYAGENTRVIDARGRTLLPGMVDAHQHLLYARVGYYNIALLPAMSLAECAAEIRRYVRAHPDAEKYTAVGYAPERFAGDGPRREMLDTVCLGRPVVALSYDGHTTWVNTRALTDAGIDARTPDPERGVICRDTVTGLPTGYLLGGAGACAGGLMHHYMPDYSLEQNKAAILRAQEEMLESGVTTVYDAHVEAAPEYYMAYEELAREGKLKLRVRGAWFIPRELGGEEEVSALIDRCAELSKLFRTDRFRVNGFKFLLDMTVEAGTAHLTEPYLGRDDLWCGVRVWEDGGMLARLFARIDHLGFQIHLHQMGDGAAKYALDALEAAERMNGALRVRHTFAHCQMISDADKARMARLKVSALAAPYWINSTVFASIDVPTLGFPRAMRQYPVRSLLDAGIAVGAHSDYPVSMPAVCAAFRGLTARALCPCAFRKYYPAGSVYTTDPHVLPEEGVCCPLPGAAERIDPRDAVRCMTYLGAYTMYEEENTGSIEPGKAADLILLDGELGGAECARVALTIADGEVLYEQASSP